MDNLKEEIKLDLNNIPPQTYFILSKLGLSAYNLYGEQKRIEPNANLNHKNVSHLDISEDGEILIITFDVSHSFKIIDTKSEKVLHDITVENNIRKILISPMKNYLMTFAHWKSEQKEGNMILWSIKTGQILKRYEQKSLDKWPIQFSPDDEYMLRMGNNKILAYKMSGNLDTPEVEINAKGATDFSINNTNPYNVAIFTPPISTKPASIKIYKWLLFKEEVASISFFRGQEVQFKWNCKGNALLVEVTSTLDTSNTNYYGNKDLYYLRTSGFTSPIESGKVIHDVAWHKFGKRFVVISGSPPTYTTVYNWNKAEEEENFGKAYVNTAKFSPNGYMLALMGFGTFKGNITLWDQKEVKEVCSVEAFTSSTFDWSPDSRYFLTATFARMQDNSYKLWAYDGTLLKEEKLDSITMAFFKPQQLNLFPLRKPSPRLYEKAQQMKKVTQKTETQKYVPPQRRGVGGSSINQKLNELRNLSDTPQYVPTPTASTGNSKFDRLGGQQKEKQLPFGFGAEPELTKKKKKKKKKKSEKNTSDSVVDSNNVSTNPSTPTKSTNVSTSGDVSSPVTEVDKLASLQKSLKKLNKKLKEIEKLKSTPNLTQNQLNKVGNELVLLEEKKKLEKQISEEKK